MSFRVRTVVVALLAGTALAACGGARAWSPRLVAWVVEEALVQKAAVPSGGTEARERLRRLIQGIPDRPARLERLLEISQRLEKVQSFDPEDVDTLLGSPLPPGTFPRNLPAPGESK
jgi:hypothetical protein